MELEKYLIITLRLWCPFRRSAPAMPALLSIACERVIARYDPKPIVADAVMWASSPWIRNSLTGFTKAPSCRSFGPAFLMRSRKWPSEERVFLIHHQNDVTFWIASPIAHEATAKFVNEGWFWRGQGIENHLKASTTEVSTIGFHSGTSMPSRRRPPALRRRRSTTGRSTLPCSRNGWRNASFPRFRRAIS